MAALDARAFTFDERCKRPASYPQYRQHVCALDGRVARSNADTRGPPPCRSEGKVLLLASVHDTFPLPVAQRVLWVRAPKPTHTHSPQKLSITVLAGDSMRTLGTCVNSF